MALPVKKTFAKEWYEARFVFSLPHFVGQKSLQRPVLEFSGLTGMADLLRRNGQDQLYEAAIVVWAGLFQTMMVPGERAA